MRKKLFGYLKIAATIVLFYILAHCVDAKTFWVLCQRVDYRLFFLGLVLVLLNNLIWVLVTREILGSTGLQLGFKDILKTNYHSYFLSLLGELVGGMSRWRGFSREQGTAKTALWAILIERFSIFFVLSAVYGCLLLFYPDLNALWAGKKIPATFGWALPLAAFAGLIGICVNKKKVPFLGRFLWGLVILCLVVGVSFFTTAVFFASVGVKLSWIQVIWVADLVWLAQVLPVTVMGLGVREGTLAYLLSVLGWPAEYGVLTGLLMFLPALVLSVLGGIWFSMDLFGGRKKRDKMECVV